MRLGEVLDAAAAAASAGATEALFTLGDRPESRWPEAAAELRRSRSSTGRVRLDARVCLFSLLPDPEIERSPGSCCRTPTPG